MFGPQCCLAVSYIIVCLLNVLYFMFFYVNLGVYQTASTFSQLVIGNSIISGMMDEGNIQLHWGHFSM